MLPPQKCKNANFMHEEIFKIGIQIFHLYVNLVSAHRGHDTCHRLEKAQESYILVHLTAFYSCFKMMSIFPLVFSLSLPFINLGTVRNFN